jgi:hypothetical protein
VRGRDPQVARAPRRRGRPLAADADRYELYQRSVQSPEFDIALMTRIYRTHNGRPPLRLREDFCGAAALACAWAASRPDRSAFGIDLDPEPLAWGALHNLRALPAAAQRRVQLVQGDVRTVRTPRADLVAAHNFSFFIFRERDQLREYFRAARRQLAEGGLLMLDVLGGSDTQTEDREEVRRIGGGVRYVWEQKRHDPINNRAVFAIHFSFKDGSLLRDAFTYDWRMWSIPELRELLAEAGFAFSEVYWEDADGDTGEGSGVFRRRNQAPAEGCWMAVIAAGTLPPGRGAARRTGTKTAKSGKAAGRSPRVRSDLFDHLFGGNSR